MRPHHGRASSILSRRHSERKDLNGPGLLRLAAKQVAILKDVSWSLGEALMLKADAEEAALK